MNLYQFNKLRKGDLIKGNRYYPDNILLIVDIDHVDKSVIVREGKDRSISLWRYYCDEIEMYKGGINEHLHDE